MTFIPMERQKRQKGINLSKNLDPTQIANLLKTDDEKQRSRANASIKRGKYPTEPRTYETWWKLPATFDKCTNEDCVDPRDNITGKSMVAEVNGTKICRYCFLAGANPIPD